MVFDASCLALLAEEVLEVVRGYCGVTATASFRGVELSVPDHIQLDFDVGRQELTSP